jgi:hypothetical protein
MSALSIQPTYPIFTDIDGQPLEDGYVWIGQANLDPQGNPIQVYWDAALTILAAQPIRTLAGYPANSGTPARLYVNSDYSIRVMNKNGSTVYSAPEATERYNDAVVNISLQTLTFLQGGSGAQPRTAQNKMRDTICVFDFMTQAQIADVQSNSATLDVRDALQNAIDYVLSLQRSGPGGVVFRGWQPKLWFPAGTYAISNTLNVEGPYFYFEGDRALLTPFGGFSGVAMQKNNSAWLITIDGLQFEKFSTAISLNSSNLDTGKVSIKRCEFLDITDNALFIECQSSIIIVDDCRFVGCKHEIYIESGDKVVFQNSWVTRGVLTANYDAGIINKGYLEIKNILGVPVPQTVLEYAWINNYGVTRCWNMRFGGEPGSHTAVNNFAPASATYPLVPNEVSIFESDVYMVSPAPAPVVRLFKVPNVIRIRSNVGFTDTVSLIAFSATVVPATEVAAVNGLAAIDVGENFGGGPIGTAPYINSALYPLMSYKTTTPITLLPSKVVASRELTVVAGAGNTAVLEYDYITPYASGAGNGAFKSFLVEFASNPNPGGSGFYLGKYVGLLTLTGEFNGAAATFCAYLTPLFNQGGGPGPTTPYTPALTWAATGGAGSAGIPVATVNKNLRITFDQSPTGSVCNYRITEFGATNFLY